MFRNICRNRAPVTLIAISCLALLLTACSSGSATASKAGLTGPVPKTKVTLTVWSFMPGEYSNGPTAYNDVLKAFEAKYPQVTVNLVNIPYPTYFQKIRDATIARRGPDVITMYGGAQAYSYRNGLDSLQNAMQPSIKANLRFVQDNYSKDGNLYILPTGTYGYALMVNKNLFAKAHINPDTALASWPNLLAACQQFRAHGIQPIASGWKDGYMFETLMYMMSSQMMDTTTLAKWVAGKIPLNSPMFVSATNDILAMNKAGCFGNVAASLGRNMYDDSFNQYYAGQTAMMVTGDISTAETAFQHVPNSTIMRLPQVPGSKYTNLIDSGAETGWGITKWTKLPQASDAFVNFLAGPQAQQIIFNTVGVPPDLKNLTIQGTNAAQKAYIPLVDNPVNHTGFEAFPLTVLAVYERNAAPLISGSMSVAAFTSQAQTAFQQSQ
jgi:ABC-type glycerol-3-phosphate transport system substrate-binding protein